MNKKQEENELKAGIKRDMHDLWSVCGDSERIVLFLEEMKVYWQIRATAEMCKCDGSLADFLKSGIETGIREEL